MKSVEAMVMVLLGDKGDFGIVFVLSLSYFEVLYVVTLYTYLYPHCLNIRSIMYTEDTKIFNYISAKYTGFSLTYSIGA